MFYKTIYHNLCLEVIPMQMNKLTFRIGELASYVTLIERICKIANRRKNDDRLDDYHRYLVGYDEHD